MRYFILFYINNIFDFILNQNNIQRTISLTFHNSTLTIETKIFYFIYYAKEITIFYCTIAFYLIRSSKLEKRVKHLVGKEKSIA